MRAHDLVAPALPSEIEDRRFFELFSRLRPFGGMLCNDSLQCLHTAHKSHVTVGVALMNRELVALKWRHRLWLPVFQFNATTWQISPSASAATAELSAVLQGFDLIEWFLTPNSWLSYERPVEVLESKRQRVHQAAQVERFLLSF